MALLPLKPCSQPGCPELVRGRPRCDRHTLARSRERRRAEDAVRPAASSRGYDADWRALRRTHLAASPSCVECGAPATDVDHLHSVREHPELRLAPSNLRSLCHSCHSRHTARTVGFGRGRGAP